MIKPWGNTRVFEVHILFTVVEMMGSMQSRDLQELLKNYSSDMTNSWKDFLSRSISNKLDLVPSSSQWHEPKTEIGMSKM